MVCSNSPLAASAGIKVMQEGGNAFDAALAVAAVEAVTIVPMCGLGGDSFILLYQASSRKVTGINSSGVAASGASADYYLTLKDGQPAIIGGTPGGDFQAQCALQIITNLLDFGLSPQEAVEAPRWWSFPGTDPTSIDTPLELRTEFEMPDETIQGLERRGHKVARRRPGINDGKVQLIIRDLDRSVLMGASDPRGDGLASAW